MKYLLTLITVVFSSVLLAQDVNMQTATVSQCGGVFYDSGGEFGNYGNDESFILTICPENPGQRVQLNFTEFSTQLNADVMTIYNSDTNDPAEAFGQFSGAASPGLVEATEANTSGCLTIEFVSNDSANGSGWAANISCRTPCQVITSQIDTAVPAPNGDGYIRVCPNEEITLTGSGNFEVDGTGATYEWDLGDGNTVSGQTAVFSYADPGVYIVNLSIRDANTTIDPEGCPNTNLINQVIQVATEADFTGTSAAENTICYGESTDITGIVNPVQFINDCTPPISGTTFLPDGSGAQYETCITVDCFDSAQTLTDPNQLIEVCVNMEHSFSGDLDIFIQSPNGQEIRLFDQAGGGTYFGGANDDGTNTPGQGEQYCFSMSASVLLANAPTETNGTNPPGNSWVPGTYLPFEDFNGLVGSPLNGDWCIRIVDNLAIDNGYIFEWFLNFDPAIQPPELSFTPAITSEAWDADPTITNTAGNVITVTPPDAGQYCYTYRATDDFGCEYTEQVCIDVLPEIVTEAPNNLFVCDTGTPPYIFDLESNTAVVLASATNVGDLVVTYHDSQIDADDDVDALTGLAAYSGTDGETIYIRVEYLDSDCYEVLPFTLNVSGQPDINPVLDLELCDDISNDGVEEFDLSVQTLGILGAQPESDFNVTYHLSFDDADDGVGVLPNLYTNVNNPEPIFVRVESAGDSNCYIASPTAVFNLIVHQRAIANQPMDMVVCDDTSNDGFATFDLSTQESDILGGQDPAIFDVSFHISQDDADNNVGNLPINYTNVTPNLETIFVRVQDPANPDCYSTTSFDLIVNTLPTIVAVTPLQVCDDDTDGFVAFNMTTKIAEILNGQSGVDVSFHETFIGADTDTAEIFDGYINTTPNNQIIYVRLENTTTNCHNVNTLDLEVLGNPTANSPSALSVCDDDTDGLVEFDLSLSEAEVIGVQTGV
ncbi:PKD domain-containing protein, partial [Winogradskyella sp.]|uniref:PKD domain-containing protein n=1 Tax=Winogradskyella sp. TaxID=1883156 RepID=UPI0026015420